MNRKILAWICLVASLVLFACTLTLTTAPGDPAGAAARMERRVGKRMAQLDAYVAEALAQDPGAWMKLDRLPPEMVVYRYRNDSLQSWCHQFPVINDDIGTRVVFQRLTSLRSDVVSPLSFVTDEVSYMNLGTKWYLVKSASEGSCRVIAGLEIPDTAEDRFSVVPLSSSGGVPVSVGGVPQFKLVNDALGNSAKADAWLILCAYLFFLVASCLYFAEKKSLRRYVETLGANLLALLAAYFWGRTLRSDVRVFSPLVYADGAVFYSLGAVLLINFAVTFSVVLTYMARRGLYRYIRQDRSGRRGRIFSALGVLCILGILFYTQFLFRSIIRNSSIVLELYKLGELSYYSAAVYVSFILLLASIVFLIQMLRPQQSGFGRVLFSVLAALYLVALSATFGLRKERGRVSVWANMLSIERDIALELDLRSMENDISSDLVISALSALPNGGYAILNRLTENYLFQYTQNYDVSVVVIGNDTSNPSAVRYFNELIRTGTPIFENSRFLYNEGGNGQVRYTGVFIYFLPDYGATRVMVGIAPKSNRENKGYASLLGISAPGQILIPSKYDYAKYVGGELIAFRGSFAYPTVMDELFSRAVRDRGVSHLTADGYAHFLYRVSEDESVVLSRPKVTMFSYFIAFATLALVFYLLLLALLPRRSGVRTPGKNYFIARVTYIMTFSLVSTLVAMAAVSVVYVYRRNDANMTLMMSDKINSIQALMNNYCAGVTSDRDMGTAEFTNSLQFVGDVNDADISIYSTAGSLIATTDNDVFNRMLLGTRVNQDAYEKIIYGNKRFFINREELAGRRYFALYAPVFNADGRMVAILSSPYVDENYDFMTEAVRHTVSIATIFLILLLLARFLVSNIVERMFKPLSEMGKKMIATNVEDLELIEYDNEDEITPLVTAYNRMVRDLSESTRQLAQAERDKAWSAMARQVAHEIKNPLTPMKLQLQRIIRLKERGAANWEEKFDEVAKIVLDHIDILTDTANEFSTFAKLYSEEPTQIDVDALLQEEIAMFDNRENITFRYMGLPGVVVTGPKPQLTRVFVNLIGNAVQAIGDQPDGKIQVSLRKSGREGCYDIVFEDNGPGVAPENVSKLFTPNFTTKSGGTGLGLAICRSILERCKATIAYSRSFTLQGACFTITFPEK